MPHATTNEPALTWKEACPSTNDELLAHALAGAPSGTAVAADRQTAGRGRRGRVWQTLPGEHILASILWRPVGLAPADLSGVTLDVGLALARLLAGHGIAARVKWPNDVLVGGLKIAGVLAELHDDPRAGPMVVIGVGLDVNVARADLPPDLAAIATSVAAELGHEVDRMAWVADVVGAVRAATRAYELRAAPDVAAYAALCATLGQRVRVEDGRLGEAVGIARDGALLVLFDASPGASPAAPEPVVAGDVIPLGPAPAKR